MRSSLRLFEPGGGLPLCAGVICASWSADPSHLGITEEPGLQWPQPRPLGSVDVREVVLPLQTMLQRHRLRGGVTKDPSFVAMALGGVETFEYDGRQPNAREHEPPEERPSVLQHHHCHKGENGTDDERHCRDCGE